MPSIRPALITRLYKAIDQNRLSDAILLLTQQYGGGHNDPEARAAHFLQELREEGERAVFSEKFETAEELFALCLALYDRFFPKLHFEGIAAARRLSELMSEEKRDAELSRALDYAYEIVQRLDVSSQGEIVQMPPHGKIADSLVRRHQIGAWVDNVGQRKVVGGDTKPLQVLIVEDNEEDAALAREALTTTDMLAIETQCAQLLSEGIDKLRNGNIDVVVLDLTLPDSNALRTLQKLRDKAPHVPVVILTGHDDDEFAFRAIKSGAHDYLVKGHISPAMLLRSVLRAAEEKLAPKLLETPATNFNMFIESAPNGMMHLSNDLVVFSMNRALKALLGTDWTGKLLTDLWPGFTAERLIEATERGGGVELDNLALPPQAAHKGAVDLALWPTHTPEGTTDGMICMILRYHAPKVATLHAASRNQGEQVRDLQAQLTEGRLEEQSLRKQVVQQSTLATISQIAQLNVESEDELFGHAVDAAAAALGADNVLVMQKGVDNHLRIRSALGEISPQLSKIEADVEFEPLYRFAYNSTSAVIIDDLTTEPFARPPKALLDIGIKSGTMVHIKGRVEPYGILCAFYKEKHANQEGDALFLTALAGILAASIERRILDVELQSTTTELRRSNEDLQQFAYAAAHDLQEPLRSVVSYLELLSQHAEGKLDEKGEKYLSVAVNGGKRMQQLINDLLEYSRVATRAKSMIRTNLDDVAKVAMQNLQTALDEAGAKVHIESLPDVVVDASQMVQLFQNLISNAIKFKKTDVPVEIKISAKQRQCEWEFIVKDNGIGLEMEYADRIFVIFHRLHARQKYAGTGIGLALCKKIIERHGGRIWVQSKPDKGAAFHFTLPIRG